MEPRCFNFFLTGGDKIIKTERLKSGSPTKLFISSFQKWWIIIFLRSCETKQKPHRDKKTRIPYFCLPSKIEQPLSLVNGKCCCWGYNPWLHGWRLLSELLCLRINVWAKILIAVSKGRRLSSCSTSLLDVQTLGIVGGDYSCDSSDLCWVLTGDNQ